MSYNFCSWNIVVTENKRQVSQVCDLRFIVNKREAFRGNKVGTITTERDWKLQTIPDVQMCKKFAVPMQQDSEVSTLQISATWTYLEPFQFDPNVFICFTKVHSNITVQSTVRSPKWSLLMRFFKPISTASCMSCPHFPSQLNRPINISPGETHEVWRSSSCQFSPTHSYFVLVSWDSETQLQKSIKILHNADSFLNL